jgi:integrase/recombinase XerD
VLLPASVWRDLQALRGEAGDADGPVFRSRKGGALTTRQAQRLVDAAARRAGLRAGVSPHWLRHAHATHALERGAPIHIVQATLGHAVWFRDIVTSPGSATSCPLPSVAGAGRRMEGTM